jgi:hypothetical protein
MPGVRKPTPSGVWLPVLAAWPGHHRPTREPGVGLAVRDHTAYAVGLSPVCGE